MAKGDLVNEITNLKKQASKDIIAGGARINGQFLDNGGNPISYVFDVFTREQPYWGSAQGYPPRDWVIKDVYPYDQNPMCWLLIYDPIIRHIQLPQP